MKNFAGFITGFQRIDSLGKKRYAYGSQKSGNYYLLSLEGIEIKDCDTVFIGEGLATMASVYLALGGVYESKTYCSLVAFDVHNIEAVVQTVRTQAPLKEIILIADNDAESEKNIGVEICNKIAQIYNNIKVVRPMLPE